MTIFTKIFAGLVITGMLFVIQGCEQQKKSPLLQEEVTPHNLVDIADKIKEEKNFTTEQIRNYSSGVSRLSRNEDSLAGKTVADVIEFEEEKQRTIAMNGLLTSSTKAEMRMSLAFSSNQLAPKKDTLDKRYDLVKFTVKNKADKDITNFSGILVFRVEGRNIKQFNISSKQKIDAGETLQLQQLFNADNRSTQVYQAKKQNLNVTTKWQPMLIEFADGEKLELKIMRQTS